MSKFKSIAILIDADNASAQKFPMVMKYIETLGEIRCRKIYGDWGQTNLSSWQPTILQYAIEPMQQFAYVKGKNATDIALVIEAMDLLYSKQYDCFCLISSDSDFASLAIRLRKDNLTVYGFGEKKAVSSFRQACSHFIEIDQIKITAQQHSTAELRKDKTLINTLNEILQNTPAESWTNVSHIGSQLAQKHPNINFTQKHGYKKLSDLIIALRLYQTKRIENQLCIRIKPKEPANTPAIAPKNKPNPTPVAKANTTTAPQNLILNDHIEVIIRTNFDADAVLWRVNQNNKVRGDHDMIFYGQTDTEDQSLSLSMLYDDEYFISEFHCNLMAQNSKLNVNKLVFSLTNNEKTSNQKKIISIAIIQNGAEIFSKELNSQCPQENSVILFELAKQNTGWQFSLKNQTLQKDLRLLCENFGIEVAE